MSDTTSIASVTLDSPIVRGEMKIGTVQIRKPGPGECRGLKLVDLVQSDVDALITLLPRITIPPLIEQEVANLDLPDFVACANEVANFLPQRGQSTGSRPE